MTPNPSSGLLSSPPSHREILRVWFAIGVQSFGGGVATLTLIRRAVVEEKRWISEEDFNRDNALVRLVPGMNLLALAVLIGRQIAGTWGIALCLAGLLLPSAAITVAITGCYARVQDVPRVQAALKGILPATVGLGLLTAQGMLRPLLRASRKEGKIRFGVALVIPVLCALISLRWSPPVVLILLGAGLIAALVHIVTATKAEAQNTAPNNDQNQSQALEAENGTTRNGKIANEDARP